MEEEIERERSHMNMGESQLSDVSFIRPFFLSYNAFMPHNRRHRGTYSSRAKMTPTFLIFDIKYLYSYFFFQIILIMATDPRIIRYVV